MKKEENNTPRKRLRIHALSGGLVSLFLVVAGIYFGITQSNWLLAAVGAVAVVSWIWYGRANDKLNS